MNPYTPGPWWPSTMYDGLSTEGGLAIDHRDEHGEIREICTVWGGYTGTDIDDETRATANLIAAAPDLLEACKAMLEEFGGVDRVCGEMAEFAIAKAEGLAK